ncbi:Fumarylacetoacetase [Arthrobotrys entomopaga]|nr:Fumarylacetoacetase [Arthrobotrys entomopaga]
MSFINIPKDCDFTLANIPFGIFSSNENPTRRPCTAIGEQILDLSSPVLSKALKSDNEDAAAAAKICESLKSTTLNAFAALGKPARVAVRNAILELVKTGSQWQDEVEKALVPMERATMHLPMEIGDYTDFYAGLNHAFNVGTLFRGPANALQPNYTHLPVGYHGRASTVVVSGTDIRRPLGQKCPPTNSTPDFDECKRLDIELELACWISKPNEMGTRIDIDDAKDYIFGYSLMNDWSARDIQAWEYVPLGPFNAKNFGTTVGGWIVTEEALGGFRTVGLDGRGTELLPYLKEKEGKGVFDVTLEVFVRRECFLILYTHDIILFLYYIGVCSLWKSGCANRV